MQQLLRDTDLSLIRSRKHKPRVIHELESTPILPSALDASEDVDVEQDEEREMRDERRSAAAIFGTKRVGAVVLPFELERSILNMIESSDKHMLHSDARRLFMSPAHSNPSSARAKREAWSTTAKYTKAARGSKLSKTAHGAREGLAYVAAAMPGQYSAVENVLREVKRRLGPSEEDGIKGWVPNTVLDFSTGTGGALWAALKVFRDADADAPPDEISLPHSTIKNYIGVNPNSGMVSLAQGLLKDVNVGDCKVSFKSQFREDMLPVTSCPRTIAVSAFVMSQLSSSQSRMQMAKDLWESGAEVIVIIDEGTYAGFQVVAEARRRILKYGQRAALDADLSDEEIQSRGLQLEEITIGGKTFVEQPPRSGNLEDVKGLCHVVAPCPHDGACPLYSWKDEIRDFCHFSQRLQRPSFVRQTKHAAVGEEDTTYSYVVIRRGPRPTLAANSVRRGSGRVGAAGREEAAKLEEKVNVRRVGVFEEGEEIVLGFSAQEEEERETGERAGGRDTDGEAIRLEAYEWPRIVYPPLKRSGHVIMDMCTSEGNIARHTIPKSQGKQAYYDARKVSWGDIFPHHPKVPPVIRARGVRRLQKVLKGEPGDAPTIGELLDGVI